jgi:hypothetical protein
MLGNYYGNPPYIISPVQGISRYTTINYVKGADIASADKSAFPAACSAAQQADATVLIVGLDQTQETEGHDRILLDLPGVQNDLITQVAQCSKGPVALVVMAGGPVDLTGPKGNPKINSILWVGYPGQSGGDAIAQVIFGDYSPAGRLPYTIYPGSFVTQVPMYDMGMRPNATSNNPGRTYRFYEGTPVYPFGYGLSYTNFNFTFPDSSALFIDSAYIQKYIKEDIYSPLTLPTLMDVSVTVKNTGNRKSDVVVQLFVVPSNPGNGNPLKFLAGFSRVHDLMPNESVTVQIPVTAHDLSLVDANGKRITEKGTWKFQVQDQFKDVIIN